MRVIKMYAIILWESKDRIKPLLNPDGTLKVFTTLKEADGTADQIEEDSLQSARVISIEGVSE